MQMEINSRHFTLGDDQRDAIEEQLEKLERFCPRPVESIKLTIARESSMFSADAVLYLKNNEFRAKGTGMEPEFAVAEIEENLRKQLTKFKGKISGRQRASEGGLGKAMVQEAGVFAETEPAIEGFVLKDLDVEAAKAAFDEADLPFLVFRNIDTSRVGVIYRRGDGELAHMEAVD